MIKSVNEYDRDRFKNNVTGYLGCGLGRLVPYKNKVLKAWFYSGPYDCPYARYA